ncbi:hypothetical protein SAMN05660710_00889 [Paracoccus tibetensis]|uniref:Uncharacterized protein n=1 Tax=Paracoccus tibetensis TaxID=336292 RepID=A0A1G5DPM4_9RHOB|nr:hypothetical protein SAMN05660710_00889 [Paracoccus tibetensis]
MGRLHHQDEVLIRTQASLELAPSMVFQCHAEVSCSQFSHNRIRGMSFKGAEACRGEDEIGTMHPEKVLGER